MVGDISMSVVGCTFGILFNKQMLADNGITTNLYDLVRNGTWTFDKMVEMMKSATKEDGDGVRTENDSYGLFNLNISNTMYSFDIEVSTMDENGYPQLFEMSNKITEAYELMRTVALDTNLHFDVSYVSADADQSQFLHVYDFVRGFMFTNDQIMFMYGAFDSMPLYKDMKSDYSIVPAPKYTEDQAEYHNGVDYSASYLGVPTTTDKEFAGAVLEYMASQSTDTIRETYIETVLKNKRTRDDDMKEMVDIIIDTLYYEVTDLFGLGIRNLFTDSWARGNLSSNYEKFRETFAEKIQTLNETIEALEELY